MIAVANRPLPEAYPLQHYRIVRQLSVGGFSIVYLATEEDGTPVVIKEYLPASLAHRDGDNPTPIVAPEYRGAFNRGMRSFFEEAKILVRLNHPNLVRVLNFFRANGTAYLVMGYEAGRSLREYLRGLEAEGQRIEENFLREAFIRLLSGLREVHKEKLLHLDIKPANIFLRKSGQPVLLDFGATRKGLEQPDPLLCQISTPGFAAPEQSEQGQPLGPWTDLYSVGATLYACLAFDPPPPATMRQQCDRLEPAVQRWRGQYSDQLLELIDWCLQLDPTRRPPSVFALQKVLSGELLDLIDPLWFDAAPAKTRSPH